MITMTDELKAKWVEALRSGKYQQGHTFLRSEIECDGGFCCLGVLCDVIDPDGWEREDDVYNHKLQSAIGEQFLDTSKVNLPRKVQSFLAGKNDNFEAFTEISHVIETRLHGTTFDGIDD